MQENHSFDNYFGTFPGADGIPRDTCMPVPRPASESRCVRPFRLGGRAIPDFPHDARTHRIQYARGAMDGFVRGASAQRQEPERSVMGYYDGARPALLLERRRRVRPVRPLLRRGAGRQRGQPPVLGHRYARGTRRPDSGRGLWRPADDLRPARRARSLVEVLRPGLRPAARSPPRERPTAAHRRYACRCWTSRASCDDPELLSHIVDLDEYYEDLERGTLPAVAYIAPAGAQRAPARADRGAGQTLVRTLVTALDAQQRVAELGVHVDLRRVGRLVRPRAAAAAGCGFRVPALLVSPYARAGLRRQHAARHHVDPEVHRGATGGSRRSPRATRGRAACIDAFDFAGAPRGAAARSPAVGARPEAQSTPLA